MKNIFFLFTVFFLFQSSKIKVIDKNTNEPISAATLRFYKNGSYFRSGITNDEGNFYFNFPYDSVVVHSLGFTQKTYIEKGKNKIIIKLSQAKIDLDEVVIRPSRKFKIIGNYKKRSSESRFISKEEQFSILFKNNSSKIFKIKSILLNIKSIPNSSDIVFKFYSIDTIQRKYKSYSKNLKEAVLTEIIPNYRDVLDSLQFKINAHLHKEILELNLDSLHIKMPAGGVFMSLYTKNIYNDEGIKVPITSLRQLPEIFNHTTDENNYCVLVKSHGIYWQNQNLVERHGEKTDDIHPIIPMKYYEPSISIKVEEIIQD